MRCGGSYNRVVIIGGMSKLRVKKGEKVFDEKNTFVTHDRGNGRRGVRHLLKKEREKA